MTKKQLIASLALILTLVVSLYFSVCSIMAIPLLDDSNSLFSKENSVNLRQQLDAYKKSYITNIDALQVDTVTLFYFNNINQRLKFVSRSGNLLLLWLERQRTVKQKLDLVEESYIVQFDTTRTLGATNRTTFSKAIQKQYLDFLDQEYTFLSLNLSKIRYDITATYGLSANNPDTSYNKNLVVEYSKFYKSVYLTDQSAPSPVNTKLFKKSLGFFNLASWPIENDSPFLALFMGVLGFAFFGSTLAGLARETIKTSEIEKGSLFFIDLVFILFKGFSASFLTYLSIKGGISLISAGTATANNTINPYFMLFACFVSAFFSDKIWELAQGWLEKK